MKALTRQDHLNIEREYCKRSQSNFTRRAWHVLEPETPYIHNWHMDALSDHLQAVADSDITRLLINIPPGMMKSLSVCVFFCAWLWGPLGRSHLRIIGASHEESLAIRDNRRNRTLIESEWFQERWPLRLVSDQNEKRFFENESRGWRQASAVKSMTGRRGDIVIWDDPLSPEKAYSEAVRNEANRIFAETLPTRINDAKKSAIIIIMQRLHDDDVSGHILANNLDYEHLMLPMEFEPDRKCYTSIGFQDPRTEDGELLDPVRFPAETVERDKKVMGSFATAGQFQQRPVPREGGLLKRSYFNMVRAVPVGTRFARGWDLAGSTKSTSPFTAGVKMGETPEGRLIITNVVRERLSSEGMEKLIVNVARIDGVQCRGSLPQDPGQAGKAQKIYLIKKLKGYRYRATPETGDKLTRGDAFVAQAEAGNVDILIASWNEDYLDEMCMVPNSKFMDQFDATSRAFHELVQESPSALFGTYGQHAG